MALVKRHVPKTSADDAALIGAVAGLLATVAYADRKYDPAEKAVIADLLSRIGDFSHAAVDAVLELFDSHIAALAHESLQTYTRVLYETMTREARLSMLDVLLDLAAADDEVSMSETNLLRRIARELGLSDDEYVSLQERYKQRLSVLQTRR